MSWRVDDKEPTREERIKEIEEQITNWEIELKKVEQFLFFFTNRPDQKHELLKLKKEYSEILQTINKLESSLEEIKTVDKLSNKLQEKFDKILGEIEKKKKDTKKIEPSLLEKMNENITHLNKKIDEANLKNTKFLFIGVSLGGVIGFLTSYVVALITSPVIPKIIFTNGTVIYP